MGSLFDLLTPLLLAALGGVISERAGVLNIALEGLVQAGAFTAAALFFFTGNGMVAALGALTVGALATLVLGWGHLKLKSDLFITGLAVNLLLPALAGWSAQALFGNQGLVKATHTSEVALFIPFLPGKGLVEEAIQGRSAFFWLALALVAALSFILFKTRLGLRLRAGAQSPELLASRGLSPQRYKLGALVASGVLGALAGAALTLHLGAYVPGISAGQGWLALAAVYLGFRSPGGTALACLVIAAAQQASHSLQGLVSLPPGLILALPPLVTCIIFVITCAFRAQKKT